MNLDIELKFEFISRLCSLKIIFTFPITSNIKPIKNKDTGVSKSVFKTIGRAHSLFSLNQTTGEKRGLPAVLQHLLDEQLVSWKTVCRQTTVKRTTS